MSSEVDLAPRQDRRISAAAALANVGESWADHVRSYERTKRHEIKPELVQGAPLRLDPVQVKARERGYDPLLARLRDDEAEKQLQAFEFEVTRKHMNRSRDIQLMREAHHNILNHTSKLHPESVRQNTIEASPYTSKVAMPRSCVDFNIVSNLDYREHHWAHPDHRPPPVERTANVRNVQAVLLKDFNVVTNRYHVDHDMKTARDDHVTSLEATAKLRQRNAFDALKQRFTCPRVEERQRAAEDARTIEIMLRGQMSQPPTYNGRHTAHYDLLSNEIHDHDAIHAIDRAEKARTSRFKTRHEVDQRTQAAALEREDLLGYYKNDSIAHERFEESARRGYDIILNRNYGEAAGDKTLHPPYTKRKNTPWERVFEDRDDLPSAAAAPRPPAKSSASASASGRSEVWRSVTPRAPAPPRAAELPPPAPRVPGSPVGSAYSQQIRVLESARAAAPPAGSLSAR